ncbi:MAG: peptidoglycan glycosyltransferase, partial [Fervidobacterium sp.]
MKSNFRNLRKIIPYIIFFSMFAFVIYGVFKIQFFESEKHKGLLTELMGKNEYLRGLRGTIYSSDNEKLAWSEKIPLIILNSYSEEDEVKLRKYLSEEQFIKLKNSGQAEISWEQAFILKNAGY